MKKYNIILILGLLIISILIEVINGDIKNMTVLEIVKLGLLTLCLLLGLKYYYYKKE